VVGYGGGARKERGVANWKALVPNNRTLGTVCLATERPSKEGLVRAFP
jgi:hypothetical protein